MGDVTASRLTSNDITPRNSIEWKIKMSKANKIGPEDACCLFVFGFRIVRRTRRALSDRLCIYTRAASLRPVSRYHRPDARYHRMDACPSAVGVRRRRKHETPVSRTRQKSESTRIDGWTIETDALANGLRPVYGIRRVTKTRRFSGRRTHEIHPDWPSLTNLAFFPPGRFLVAAAAAAWSVIGREDRFSSNGRVKTRLRMTSYAKRRKPSATRSCGFPGDNFGGKFE